MFISVSNAMLVFRSYNNIAVINNILPMNISRIRRMCIVLCILSNNLKRNSKLTSDENIAASLLVGHISNLSLKQPSLRNLTQN